MSLASASKVSGCSVFTARARWRGAADETVEEPRRTTRGDRLGAGEGSLTSSAGTRSAATSLTENRPTAGEAGQEIVWSRSSTGSRRFGSDAPMGQGWDTPRSGWCRSRA